MPESYRPPLKADDKQERTSSQTVTTNMLAAKQTVGDVLATKSGDVISIRPQETLGRAVEILRDKGIGALMVTDQAGALVGILSERDIVRKLADAPGKTLPHKVEEVMTTNVQTCRPDETLVVVLRRLTDGRFRHMPVVDDSGLLGMITVGDVVSYRLVALEHEALQLKQLIVG